MKHLKECQELIKITIEDEYVDDFENEDNENRTDMYNKYNDIKIKKDLKQESVSKDISQFSNTDKKNLKLQTDSYMEYIENKKKRNEKKCLSSLSQNSEGSVISNQSMKLVDLKPTNSMSSNSSHQTTKFYKKIIQGQEFELEVHGKNEKGEKKNSVSSNQEEIPVEELSDSDEDDLDRQ